MLTQKDLIRKSLSKENWFLGKTSSWQKDSVFVGITQQLIVVDILNFNEIYACQFSMHNNILKIFWHFLSYL